MRSLHPLLAGVLLGHVAACGLEPVPTPGIPEGSTPVRTDAGIEAQRIRDEAGIPPGQTVGVRPGPAPGLSKRAALEPSDRIRITSRADAEQWAAGGEGTARDPYRIEHRSILAGVTATSGDFGFDWEDPDAGYHLSLHNVEIGGFTAAQVRVNAGTGLEVSHASLFGAEGAGVHVGQGKVSIRRCAFSGLGSDGVRTIASAAATVELSDCAWTEERGPWSPDAVGAQSRSSNPLASITVRYSDFTAPSLPAGVRTWNEGLFSVSNCRFTCRNGIQVLLEPIRGLSVQYCLFEVSDAPVLANRLEDGWDIGHNEFRDSADGQRLIRLNDCRDGRVHHNLFTKTVGSEPGNECLEGFDCADVIFDRNWVTQCTEDAYEHVRPRGGCLVFDNVGDQVAGQIVDFFGYHPSNGGEIHHIYGDCRDVGVIVTDVDNVTVHDIHTNNTLGTYYNVRLENRHSEPGLHPAGCTFLPPLPDPLESYQGFVFGAVGPVGPGNQAQWWQDGVLRTWSSSAPTGPSRVARPVDDEAQSPARDDRISED